MKTELLDLYLDGALSSEQVAELEAALSISEEARTAFWDRARLHAALRMVAQERRGAKLACESPPRAVAKVVLFPRAARHRLLALAALLLLGAIGGWAWRQHQPVARIGATVAATWEGKSWQRGEMLRRDSLKLAGGVVEVAFLNGARVVLEGPAEIKITGMKNVRLTKGRLSAVVPPRAHGFQVQTADFIATDLGTHFGVSALPGETPQVHVFAGRVELARTTGHRPARVFSEGQAVQIGENAWIEMPADRSTFVSLEAVSRSERREVWAELDRHPAALVHYDFEGARGSLQNRVSGRDITAGISGCEPAEGRWPGKGALAFTTAEDRVRFTVPGEMQSLTLLAWVRVDALPNVQSSLLMGESELPGEVHWYLNDKGRVGFAIIAPDGRWRALHTEPLLQPALFGKWIFLAATYDGATRTAMHYVNGQRVAAQVLDGVGPLRLRTVEIGNWGVRPGMPLRASATHTNEPLFFVRNLHGRMDEFAILSTPLSAAEIQRYYEASRPEPVSPK